jgi:hypothetical protein
MSLIERGCIVPLSQSLATLVIGGVMGYMFAQWMQFKDPITFGIGVGCVLALYWWIGSLWIWRDDTYPKPIDEVAPMQETTQQLQVVRIVLTKEDGNILFVDLPASHEEIKTLAEGLLNGISFSEESWSGPGSPCHWTRKQFRQIRDIWIHNGWAYWVSTRANQQGVAVTSPGRAVCREILRYQA